MEWKKRRKGKNRVENRIFHVYLYLSKLKGMKMSMKKHLSVFMLMARSTIYKVLVALVVMAVAEFGLFYGRMEVWAVGDTYNLETMIDGSHILWVFGAVFVLITILLCQTGCGFSSKIGYTLRRLSISERMVFVWQALYNSMVFCIFWMVQILLIFVFCRIYVIMAPEGYVTNQTIFLAFYRNDFLHSLLPMEDAGFWVKNVLTVFSMGICSAHYPMAQRRGKKIQEVMLLTACVFVFFVGELGEYVSPSIIICCCMLCVLYAVFQVFSRDEDEESTSQG